MLQITRRLAIDESELALVFIRSAGPADRT